MASKRAPGSGSIHRDRQRGGWVAVIEWRDPLTGKRRTRKRRARTRDEARAALAALQGESGTARPEGTLAAYLADWRVRRLPNASVSDKTKTTYADMLRWYAEPAAGSVLLADLTPALAEAWLQAVRETPKRDGSPLSEATVRKVYSAAVKALDAAVTDGALAANPLRSVDRPKVSRPSVPMADADHTAAAIEATSDLRIGPLVVLVAWTGLRLGEALGLRWADVALDGDAPHIVVRRSGADTDRTKTGRVRSVPLVPEAVGALRAVRSRQRAERLAVGPGWSNPDGLVFTTASGAPMDAHNARRDLQRALKGAGLEAARPFHAFRHGLAARLLREGVPLPVVSAILGHAGIQVTADTYGHLDAMPASIIADALGGIQRAR